jgi:hypothetical protein
MCTSGHPIFAHNFLKKIEHIMGHVVKRQKNCPVNSHVGASKFIFLHKTKKYFSLKLVCEYRMFGCTYKKS